MLSSSIRILSKRRLNREREKEEEKVERLSPMDIYIYIMNNQSGGFYLK